MAQLPEGFAALETWVTGWAQPTQNRRWDRRLRSTKDELLAFYRAVSPELERILEHVDGFPLGALPEKSARLLDLAMMLAEIAPNVELYDGAPDVPHSFAERRFLAVHGDDTGSR